MLRGSTSARIDDKGRLKVPNAFRRLVDWCVRYRWSAIALTFAALALGVFGMIYESRPNVTFEAACLAIKSGNACILRGGSEALHSNLALWQCVQAALTEAGLPAHAVQQVPTTDREAVGLLISQPQHVDVVIPRGGRGLIERITAEAKVPVIKHLDGNCHTYVDDPVDLELAFKVTDNAKTQKYSPCNATESLLVARSVARAFLPRMAQILSAKGVELRCCPETRAVLQDVADARLVDATEQDWFEEFLAPIISIKVVASLDEAIAHINRYGSHHTDCIVTSDTRAAERFLDQVDSAIVLHNASTQFADGGEFGFGAEIGISTGRLHARGPVGVEQLTTYKYMVRGTGQVRP